MAKVEGMRGKDNSKPVFVKKGAPNIAPTFRNNNNKRPNVGRDVTGDKRVKIEDRQLAENCKFYDKPGHRAEECWKKLGACLRCGGHDHRIPDCPMMKDQPGGAQNAPRPQGCLNAGRVEEFLAAGEAGDPHTKPFFFPVVSAATCTDHHLEVDQSFVQKVFWKATSFDTLSQIGQKVFWELSLVSAPPELVSKLIDLFA
ncbi:hypothetical protein Taro_014389 [Colocasia esculenta]|uniref:CCHC-type domain-containing protein n=1 Tax=Colocasia esculenta TaxID=4460 RepID=A0A843ULP8_COLES|nr:hypothetical protein [Colocasia esculenta]